MIEIGKKSGNGEIYPPRSSFHLSEVDYRGGGGGVEKQGLLL